MRVVTLMGPGVDPHLYRPTPSDLRALSEAEIVFCNGLHLEGKLGESLKDLGRTVVVVAIAEGVDTPEKPYLTDESDNAQDPHIWFDLSMWARTAERVRDGLVRLEPQNEELFAARAAEKVRVLQDLHGWIGVSVASIPEGQRVLVTAHDAFRYFGRAYGIEVMGVQGVSTESEAGLQRINQLVSMLSERKVPAVFVESSVPARAVEALIEGCRARGHTVVIGAELYSDAMGDAGSGAETFEGMIRHNVRAITTALGGKPAAEPPMAGVRP